MLLLLTFFVVYAVLDAVHDSLIKNHNNHWHRIDALIKLTVLSLIAYISIFNPIHIKHDYMLALEIVFVALTIRWIVFDLVYNLLTGQKWYYVGNTAWTDCITIKKRTIDYNWLSKPVIIRRTIKIKAHHFPLKFVCLLYSLILIGKLLAQ